MNAEEINERHEELDAMFLDLYSFVVVTSDCGDYTLWSCSDCGAIVRNCGVHYQWHKKQEGKQ